MADKQPEGVIHVLCVTPEAGAGWAPITTLASLAARLWGGKLWFHHPTRLYSRTTQVLSMVPPRRGSRDHLLVIAAHPGSLLSMAEPPMLWRRFASVSAWIFDDFWQEWIPRFTRTWRAFDRVWLTNPELVDIYTRRMKSEIAVLPWGSDTLHPVLTSADRAHGPRTIDVLRLGRQPAVFDDDRANQQFFAGRGLSYAGRFEAAATAAENQAAVVGRLRSSKVVVASSPTASPEDYTHRTRDYLTARWTDAAAAGAIVVGRQPRCQALGLLPAEGLIDIDVSAAEQAREAIVAAVADWSPERSERIRRAARQLDWRWRLAEISTAIGSGSARLAAELAMIGGD